MKNISFWLLALLVSFSLSAFTQSDIDRAEYFFDEDPGFGMGINIPITAGQDVNLNQNIDISSAMLSQGRHRLHIRFQNSTGRWSHSYISEFYYFDPPSTPVVSKITEVEYFFDIDPGVGKGVSVNVPAPVEEIDLSFPVDITGITTGLHLFYVRVKNEDGHWGLAHISTFTRGELGAEYFFDTDPGFGNGTSLAVVTNGALTEIPALIDISALPKGRHTVNVRLQDAGGQWSHTYHHVFYKYASTTPPPISAIARGEYFFNTDPGMGKGIPISITGTSIDHTFQPDISHLIPGENTIHFRFKNNDGGWGHTFTQTFTRQLDCSGLSVLQQPNAPIASGFYGAEMRIESAAIIPAGVDVIFVAPDIDLLADFDVEFGGTVKTILANHCE